MKKLYLFFFIVLPFITLAQPVINFQSTITGLTGAVDMAHAGDNRLFIVEQSGKIKIWNGSSVLTTPFIDLTSTILSGGERGLLSVAFHPNYAINRYFFVYYNAASTGNVTIARYQRSATDANVADTTSGVVLMSIPKPFDNHNGGKLNFGPDGYLYFGTGDGGSGGDPNNNAQNGSSNLGKMMRLDVTTNTTTAPYYTIPATNPYTTNASINDEIIAIGLRNPWRWSFDKLNGDIWLADVGQDLYEEVNYRPAASTLGLNYGWRCYEGTHNYNTAGCSNPLPNNVVPIYEYDHNNTTGGFSITGGYVYRGSEFPAMYGYYIFADYVSKNFWLTVSNGAGGFTTTKATTQTPSNLTSFGEAFNGDLYALGANGIIYKITTSTVVPVKLGSFTVKKTDNHHQLNWEAYNQTKGEQFIIERSIDNNAFETVATITITQTTGKANYSKIVGAINAPVVYYRLKMISVDGGFTYSPIINLKQNGKLDNIKVYKNGNLIIINSDVVIKKATIFDITGKELTRKNVAASGTINVDAVTLGKGILLIHLNTNQGNKVFKIIN